MSEAAATSDFVRTVEQFGAHIRDPARHPGPAGADPERMALYRQLFYDNIERLVSFAFPKLRELMSAEHWHALVGDFLRRHRCQTPYFRQIGGEFVAYLEHEREPEPFDLPFLLSFAHYQWTRIALESASEEICDAGIDPSGDFAQGWPVVSPLACALAYPYRVHRIGPACQPTEPLSEPCHLVVCRDRRDGVRLVEASAMTAHLFQRLQGSEPLASGSELLLRMADEADSADREAFITQGMAAMERLRAVDALLGTRRRRGAG